MRRCTSSGSDVDQPKREVDVPVGDGVLERGAQVVVVGQHPLDPGPLVGALHAGGGALGELGVVRAHAARDTIVKPVVPQAIPAVRAQRLQDAVARPVGAAAHDHHGLVDEPGEQVERVVLGRAVRAAHAVCRLEVEATREHRQPHEQRLLGLGEQPVGPVDRRGEALVPGQRAARATAEQPQPVQPPGHVEAAHHPHPRGGQLDRQRQAVESATDLGDRADGLVVEVEVRPAGPGAVARTARWRPRRAAAAPAGSAPLDAERFPAGGQHR